MVASSFRVSKMSGSAKQLAMHYTQFYGVHEVRCEGSFAFLDRVLRGHR